MAKVISVNISEKKGTFKYPIEKGTLKREYGIDGDAHAGNWHRQISLLAQESVDKMAALGAKDLVPGIFAENVTTEGIELFSLPVGTRLRVGEAIVEVTQIGKECHQHCQIYQQVGMCVMPTEGIFVIVIREGDIRPGDEITVLPNIRAGILIASDKGSAGVREDLSGPALEKALEGLAHVGRTVVIPDERELIANELRLMADCGEYDVIFTSGGTGFTPRDVTPEATQDVIDRLVPGIPEAMRAQSMKYTKNAMLSRAIAGIRKQTLIVNMPGSPKAVVECLEVIKPVLPHAAETLRGTSGDCALKD
jgi:molybdenum cofactor synthesis domain-containing protein